MLSAAVCRAHLSLSLFGNHTPVVLAYGAAGWNAHGDRAFIVPYGTVGILCGVVSPLLLLLLLFDYCMRLVDS